MSTSLTRAERLSKSLLRAVFVGKKQIKGLSSKLMYLENSLNTNRFAITFCKNYGNAIVRNYVKRIHKEIYRLNKDRVKKGYDLVVVLYPSNQSYDGYKERFWDLLCRAGLLV